MIHHCGDPGRPRGEEEQRRHRRKRRSSSDMLRSFRGDERRARFDEKRRRESEHHAAKLNYMQGPDDGQAGVSDESSGGGISYHADSEEELEQYSEELKDRLKGPYPAPASAASAASGRF